MNTVHSESNSEAGDLFLGNEYLHRDLEIEETLINLFNNFEINNSAMAPPELKEHYLNMIPNFSGEVQLLPDFIRVCESLVTHFYDTQNPDNYQNVCLMLNIKAKITGQAKLNLSSYTLETWDDLKKALLNTYGDKRDCFTLVFEMCNVRQGNLSAHEFHTKIQTYINLHASYVDTHNVAGKSEIKQYVAELGLRSFLRNLKEPLGSIMRTRNPQDLNDALNILTNEYQMEANYRGNQSSSSRYPPNSSNRQTNQYTGNSFQRSQNQNQNQQNWNQNRNFQQKNTFNSSNSANWRNQQNQQTPGTSRQNVWNKQEGNLPKPTPMSAQTLRSNLHNVELGSMPFPEEYYPPNPPIAEEEIMQPEEDYGNETIQNEDFRFGASDNQEYY